MQTEYTPIKKSIQNISVSLILHSTAVNAIWSRDDMFTFEIEAPRFILPEHNTHRETSKNVQSSRAVPFKRTIQLIEENPWIPVHWGKNQAGMTSKEQFTGDELKQVQELFVEMRESSIHFAKRLAEFDPHKQWAARTIENWGMTKIVMSSTWSGICNLLWLRKDESAQPEFEVIASLLYDCIKESVPQKLQPGQWHLPYVKTIIDNDSIQYFDSTGESLSLSDAKKISASCCAQASYRRLNDTKEKAMEIYEKLFSGPKLHMSPTEHQATPVLSKNDDGITHYTATEGLPCSGNLKGWIQYRQLFKQNAYYVSMQDFFKQC